MGFDVPNSHMHKKLTFFVQAACRSQQALSQLEDANDREKWLQHRLRLVVAAIFSLFHVSLKAWYCYKLLTGSIQHELLSEVHFRDAWFEWVAMREGSDRSDMLRQVL